jgi:outer membrane lipoprotein-sorting protein
MKKKAVRRRVAVRCTLFSIVLLIFVFAQVQAMAAELAGTVDGASQAETSQTNSVTEF